MRLQIDVASWHDGYTLDKNEKPPQGAVVQRVEEGGETRPRVIFTRHEPSTTFLAVPDADLEASHADHVDGLTAVGRVPKSRERFLADHVESVMEHHSQELTGLNCDDPDMEKYLRARFDVGPAKSTPHNPDTLSRDEARQRMRDHYSTKTEPEPKPKAEERA